MDDTKELLGRGSYGDVFKEIIDGKSYAVKKIINNDINEIEGFLPEVDMIMRIDHPNVIRGVNFELRDDDIFYFTMELAVSLDSILKNSLIDFEIGLNYIHNIGCGVNFIMKSGYAHCDIKIENILIINGIAKLADFGLVVSLDPNLRGSDRDERMCETSIYKSPEHILGLSTKITEMSEIWSYGYIVLSIIYNRNVVDDFILERGILTWDATLLIRIYEKNNNPIKTFKSVYGNIPKKFDKIIESVGHLQIFDRFKRTRDLTDFLKHPFFQENNIKYNENVGIIKLPNDELLAEIPKKSDQKMLDILCKWMVSVCLEYRIRIQPMCLGIEILRRIIHRYDLNEGNMQLFGISCLFIANKITLGDNLEDLDAVYISDGIFDEETFKETVFEIMSIEKGAISYTTIYNIAKSKTAFIKSFEKLMDSSFYYREDMRSSSNIARFFLNKYPQKLDDKDVYIKSSHRDESSNLSNYFQDFIKSPKKESNKKMDKIQQKKSNKK